MDPLTPMNSFIPQLGKKRKREEDDMLPKLQHVINPNSMNLDSENFHNKKFVFINPNLSQPLDSKDPLHSVLSLCKVSNWKSADIHIDTIIKRLKNLQYNVPSHYWATWGLIKFKLEKLPESHNAYFLALNLNNTEQDLFLLEMGKARLSSTVAPSEIVKHHLKEAAVHLKKCQEPSSLLLSVHVGELSDELKEFN